MLSQTTAAQDATLSNFGGSGTATSKPCISNTMKEALTKPLSVAIAKRSNQV